MFNRLKAYFVHEDVKRHYRKRWGSVADAASVNEDGRRHYAEGRMSEAAAAFERAGMLGSASGWYNLATIYALRHSWVKAGAAYKRGVAINPDFENASDLRVSPAYVQIETIRACNAACIMCPLETSPTPNRVMSDDLFRRVVAQIAEMRPVPGVAVHGLGEPLMDKKLIERVRHLKVSGVPHVSLVSNATLMTKEEAITLINAGVGDASFSIESVDQATFEKIRVGLKLEDAVRGILDFIEVRNSLKPSMPVRLMFTYSELNREQFPDFEAFWKRYLTPGLDGVALIPVHSFGKFTMSIRDNFDPCYQIFSDMHIRADGTVSLCCIDVDGEYKIGDGTKATLLDIYNCRQMKFDRHRHLLGQRHCMKLCADCDQPEVVKMMVPYSFSGAVPRLDADRKLFVNG